MRRCSFLVITIVFCVTQLLQAATRADMESGQLTISRFDVDVYNWLKSPGSNTENKIKGSYINLLPAFTQIVTGQHPTNSGEAFKAVKKYFSHPSLMSIYDDALNMYSDTKDIENELDQIASRLSTLYPDLKLPQLTFHVSGFKENTILIDNTISISIDKYLGADYSNYKNFFPAYERIDMTRKSLIRDYLKAWILSDVINKKVNNEQTLLSSMINDGKVLYVLSQLLPEYSIAELMGYSAAQIQWSETNERGVWREILKQNHLHTKDYIVISRYIEDSEFTQPLFKGTPGRISSWIGYRIVSEYVKNNNSPVNQLLDTDSQSIFKDSKYKP